MDKRKRALSEIHDSNVRIHFYCKDDQMLEQSAWKGCGVSIPGGMQNLTGHGPACPAVTEPALSKWAGLDNLQVSLPISNLL